MDEIKESELRGISEKTMVDGSTSIMVRFKYRGRTYSVKNFTKIFKCNTRESAAVKLREVKKLIDAGKDPFGKFYENFEDLFMEKAKINLKNGTWKETTYNSRMYYYKNHIKKPLGNKSIENITYNDVDKILKKFGSSQGALKNQLFDLLKPVFREEFNKGHLEFNLMDRFLRKRYPVQKEELAKRSHTKHVDMVRQLYQAIALFDSCLTKYIEQYRTFFYLILMTAHRSGELCDLTKEHCNIEKKIITATPEITKTDETYIYPLPEECIEYIKNHEGGKLFNFNKATSAGRAFKKLVELADIEVVINQNISLHDTRKLMMSVMINNLGIDSRIADFCLEHKQTGVIKHYIEMDYELKENAFFRYWDCLRGTMSKEVEEKKEIANTNVASDSNIDKIKDLIQMLKEGYLTKEEFEIEKKKLIKV